MSAVAPCLVARLFLALIKSMEPEDAQREAGILGELLARSIQLCLNVRSPEETVHAEQ